MTRRRTALVTTGLAAGAVAGGLVGRAVMNARRRRADPEAHEPLSLVPPEELGPVTSFDGTRLAVYASGDPAGPLLLFVHGFSLDLTTWHYQWTELSASFRCVLMDLRSHGRSDRAAEGDLSPSAFGQDLAAVIESLPADRPVVLVGHSMGSMAILAMAEVRPDLFESRVAGCVFVGSAASDLLRGLMGSITGLLRPRLGSLRQAVTRVDRVRRAVLASPGDVAGLVARLTQFGPHASPHVVAYVVSLAGRAPTEVWTDGLAGLMDLDLRHALEHVGVPALVLVGGHDRVTPPSAAVALADALPDARLEVINDAGHIPMMEMHEEFNRRLERFSRGVLGPSSRGRKRRSA